MNVGAPYSGLDQVSSAALAAARPERIAVKSRAGVVVLRLPEIDWVEANEDYAALHVGAKSWLIRDSMHSLASRWASAGFVRIHRSTLVNADRVRELRPLSKGEFTVVLFDGTELKMSRSYRSSLSKLAGSYETATPL